MPDFVFRVIDRAGAPARLAIDAASEAEAIETIKRRGLILLGTAPRRGASLLALLNRDIGGAPRLGADALADFTRELAAMLGAGLDLERALRFAAGTAATPRVRAIILAICDKVRDGAALWRALGHEPRSFPPFYVGLVRAGEESGALAATLEDLAELLERNRSLRAAMIAGLTYPALLALAATGAIVFLLTNVLPEFVPIFAENGVPLPATTRLLLTIGQACAASWPYALALFALAIPGIRLLLARPAPRLRFDRLVLRLPLLGALLREALAARFTRTLGTLLGNGVALVPAMAIVQNVIGNRAAARAIATAADAARHGKGLAAGLAAARLMPERTVQLLRLGEETGQLGRMALRAAAIHEERARLGVQKLVSLLVPAITILMGGAIGFIVASLLLAMLGLDALAH